MNAKIFLAFALGMMFLPIASAQTLNVNIDMDNAVCVGDNIRATANITNNGTLSVITQTEACPFGCDSENNRCNPSPFDGLLYYVVGGVVGIFLLILVIVRLAR